MVWTSSRWISANRRSCSSRNTIWHLHLSCSRLHSSRRGSRHRWGWPHDSCPTTSHCRVYLHTSRLPIGRCPDLECWTSSQDAHTSVHQLSATYRTLTRFNKPQYSVSVYNAVADEVYVKVQTYLKKSVSTVILCWDKMCLTHESSNAVGLSITHNSEQLFCQRFNVALTYIAMIFSKWKKSVLS